jgi:hypothetical protein
LYQALDFRQAVDRRVVDRRVVDRRVVDRRVVDKQVVDRSRGRADTPTGPSGAELDFLLLGRSLLGRSLLVRRCQILGDPVLGDFVLGDFVLGNPGPRFGSAPLRLSGHANTGYANAGCTNAGCASTGHISRHTSKRRACAIRQIPLDRCHQNQMPSETPDLRPDPQKSRDLLLVL